MLVQDSSEFNIRARSQSNRRQIVPNGQRSLPITHTGNCKTSFTNSTLFFTLGPHSQGANQENGCGLESNPSI